MEKTDYDALIATIEGEIREYSGLLAMERKGLIEALGTHLESWYDDEARLTAAENPTVTKKLGPRLAELKAEVAALKARAGDIAASALDREDMWPDRGAEWPSTQYGGGVMLPASIPSALAACGAELGDVLRKYGFTLREVLSGSTRTSGGDRNWWRAFDWRNEPDRVAPDVLPMSKELSEHLTAATRLASQLKTSSTRLAKARADKAKAEATELWDKA